MTYDKKKKTLSSKNYEYKFCDINNKNLIAHQKRSIMSQKEKIVLEFPFRSLPHIIYECVSTATGLGEWFADKVLDEGDEYTFIWSGSKERAFQIGKETNKYVRYRWEDRTKDEYFEFRIERNELTNETLLIVTDHVDKSDISSQTALWESQINDLKHRVGA
jgi:hypothetical protein